MGSLERSSSITGRPVKNEMPKSKERVDFTYRTNCTGRGLSRPYTWLSLALASGEKFGSMMEATGSPGIIRKSMKFKTSTSPRISRALPVLRAQ